MKKGTFFFLLLFFTSILRLHAQGKTIVIDAGKPLFDVPPHLWGLFFEDINLAADGGLYAEMVKNRSFEFYEPMMGWKQVSTNSQGALQVLNRSGEENPRYLRMIKSGKGGDFGILNEGFRGMFAEKGAQYRVSLLARNAGISPVTLTAGLVDPGGAVIGQTTVSVSPGDWKKYESSFSCSSTEYKATFRILANEECIVDLDMVSLFPAGTWKNRENGLRADLVQMLADLKPGFLRFPGGCIVEGHELATRYQWKKSVGPVENRHQIINRWNSEFSQRSTPDYYQSFGLGFFEYFLLCEDIGAEPLPILNCGMACQFNTAELVPLDELEPYIDDILDLVEFARGPADSEWGKVRASMGHPGPFRLNYLGVGNEQWGPQYAERLEIFRAAIKRAYPDIQLVGSAGPFPEGKEFDFLWGKMKALPADLVDEHYYRPPEWFLSHAGRYDNYDRQGPKVFAGEYAAHSKREGEQPESRNNWEAALAEAAFMTGIERNCDVVRLASYAPLFGHTEGWQWRPDLIWFDNHRCAGTPGYYVQKLFSTNKGASVIGALCDGKPLSGQDSLYASATLSDSNEEVILKVVNSARNERKIEVSLPGTTRAKKEITQLTLSSDDPAAFNALGNPGTIRPVEKTFTLPGRLLPVTLRGSSFTVLKISIMP